MKAQYSNRVLSSILLFIDNKICTKGQAYINTSSYFYPATTNINGYYSYVAPYNQIIYDTSITGATIMTGVYLNSTFITTGQSGFAGIDYNNGRLYFTSQIPDSVPISGSYAIKEYNICLTNQPDEKLLVETKYSHKSKLSKNTQTVSGLKNDEVAYPVIFIRQNQLQNEPFSFGGQDLTKNYIRFTVLSDSQFSNDAVNSICADLNNVQIPLLSESQMPFNYLGLLKSQPYNYLDATAANYNNGELLYIERTSLISFFQRAFDQTLKEINPEVFTSIIDIETSKARYPRQE